MEQSNIIYTLDTYHGARPIAGMLGPKRSEQFVTDFGRIDLHYQARSSPLYIPLVSH